METSGATQVLADDSEPFDLDVSLIELVDPGILISMTDDNCGNTCEKDTCVSGN